jgi:hypothetical protein
MQKLSLVFVVAAASLGAALSARPSVAHACECSRPGVEVSPGAGLAAPTNTVVRVSWWIGEVKIDESTLQIQPAGADKERSKAKPKKKGKGKDQDDAPPPSTAAVEVETTVSTSGQVRTIILKPKAALLPSTRYEVRVASAAGEKAGVIGEFDTGPADDAKPPEWAGVAKATYVHQPAVCCTCNTSDAYAVLELGDAGKVSDDATPVAGIVYGVWLDDGSKLEPGLPPAAPPLLLTRAWSGKLYLGHKSQCAPVNFDLPTKAGPLKLRVAPVDLSGRVGKVSSVTLDVPKPKDPPAAPARPAPTK